MYVCNRTALIVNRVMKKFNGYFFWFVIIFNEISRFDCNQTVNRKQLLNDMPKHGFGKYVVMVRDIQECITKETIDKESFISYGLRTVKANETDEEIFGYMYLPKSVKYVKGRLTPFIVKRDGSLTRTLNRTSYEPCNDFVLSIPVKVVFSPDMNCYLEQGNYSVENFNVNQFAHSIGGDNFVYGRMLLTVEYFSKSGLVFCVDAIADIRNVPKVKRIRKTHKKRH